VSEERILWQGKPSYRALIFPLVFTVAFAIIPVVGWLLSALIFLTFIWNVIQIRVTSYKITTTTTTEVRGIRKQERKIPVTSISYVTVEKPVAQWILGCRKIEVVPRGGTGSSRAKLWWGGGVVVE